MKNKKNCKNTLKRVVTIYNKTYDVKESDIHEGYWCPNAFHTFFNDLDVYNKWREHYNKHKDDDDFSEFTLDTYCCHRDIDYYGFPFEEYVDESVIKDTFTSYKYVWNSNDESVTPTSEMLQLEHYGTEKLGIVFGKYIYLWSDLHKCDRQIPVEVLGDSTNIKTQ